MEMTRETYKIDAENQVLGRLATDIAMHLMGKHRPNYQPHIDSGDIVEVSNVGKIQVSGKKMQQKKYYRHSGYPGGLKTKVMEKIWAEDPAQILKAAVSRMLPKNKLRADRMKRLIIK